jgi:membrane associated rhomboid family serine protease
MARRLSDRFTFGGRVPGVVGLIMAVTTVTSLVVAFGSRHGASLFELGALVPERVWGGQLWRLVTWGFIEPSPLWLLFTCLMLFWVGRDLVQTWGTGRFTRSFFAVVLAASVGTCLIALVDPPVRTQAFIGAWPVVGALVVAWGLYHPWRVVRIWFVLPLRGYVLAWLTVGLTVAYAIYSGWESHLPSLLAQATMIGWAFKNRIKRRLSRPRPRASTPIARPAPEPRRTTPAGAEDMLRRLEAFDDDPPPLSAEVEGMLEKIVEDVSREERAKRSQSDSDR